MSGGGASGLRILVADSPGEQRVALMQGDTLREYWVDRPARPDGMGDLHRARVTALAPAMSGAFVALGNGTTGFLPEAEASAGPERPPIGKAVQVGSMLTVRVIRASQGGKGPRVSARLGAAGDETAAAGPPRLLARGPGAALRLARAHPGATVVVDSAALAATLRGALGPERVALSRTPAFDDALEAEVEALAGAEVTLPGGGRLLVHPTPALTAIDVDAGSAAGARDPLAQARLNAAAMAEAARQIRLRNLAGPILIDAAGLSVRQRGSLLPPLRQALAGDPLVALKGLGPLGLFELLRRRVHPPLHEVLGWPPSPLTHGLAALRRAARETTVAGGAGRMRALRAAPAVLRALAELPGTLEGYAATAGRALALHADPSLAPGQEAIEEVPPHGIG
jgi:ribonuclease G